VTDTNKNTGCEQARDLFSPFLDGELSEEERTVLDGHLRLCSECRQELDIWRKMSETLRQDNIIEEELSPGFATGVMKKLQSEAEDRYARKLHPWYRPVAAAAAAILIFGGSWGVRVAMNDTAPQSPVAAIEQQSPDTGKNFEIIPETGNTEQKDIVDPAKPAETGTSNPGQENTGGSTVNQPADTQVATAETVEKSENTALLGVQCDMISTILKIKAADPAAARAKAMGMAANLSGDAQVLNNKGDGGNSNSLIIIRMSVPRESRETFLSRLSGLGAQIERTDEKKDISVAYTETLNRLKEMEAKIAAGTGDVGQMQAEASGLKKQIEMWDKEASSYVVILWLE